MDETNNLAPRERPGANPGDAIQSRTPFLALDLMPREPHLLDYLLVLRKHQWLIMFFLLAVVSIVTIATFRMRPIYEATARVEIDRENNNAMHFADSTQEDEYADLEDYIVTQSKILQSETLAMLTVRSMGLDRLPQYGGQPGKPVKAAAENSLVRPAALGAFLGGLSIKRVPNTRLLDVTYESTDPALAARIVNAHINNFIEQNFRSKFEAATQASNWLTGQLNEMKIKVENAEDARLAYERENQIWTIDEKNDISTQKLADLNKQLTDAQADRINKEAVYQLAQSGNYDAIAAVRESQVIQDILKQQTTLTSEYADAVNQYGPKYPKVLRIQAQIKDLDQLITREKVNIGNQVEADYRGARQRELLLQQALDQQKAQTNATAEKLVQYNILNREAEANKQLYDGMLQKLKEAGISAGLRSSNIRIVDPALIPTGPSRPNKTRNIMLSILVGFIGGIGLALLREYLDNTVKTPDDIETLARLPSLAVVPALSSSSGKRSGRLSKLLKTPVIASKEGRAELISHNMPQSQMSEAFRALRTSLLLSQADHPPQVILMTSALPREGKTTAAVNLAVTLAQLGDKTLLVDADLRKPGINRALSLVDGKHAGLSSYLAGVSSLDLITVPHPAITNLAAIPTGPIPPNPADLLSSRRLTELIGELRSRYKFIVIDSPPIMAATDAVILSVLVDGVLMVVRSGETPKEAFVRTRDLLAGVKCHMLGVVLNAVDASSPDYYYSYRYYPYSYGGYGREDESRKSRKARRAEAESQLGQD
ncbi:MAG: polysaccharide biosynthesis tyrosine autokinase [Acidobacteriia bacterium]|nr:polysaccharide biosynthesis tyrosine autokinase [Terriglobia bacterium]